MFALSVEGTISVCLSTETPTVRRRFLVPNNFGGKQSWNLQEARSKGLPPKMWSGRETHKTRPRNTNKHQHHTKEIERARSTSLSLSPWQWHDDFHHHDEMCRWSPLIGADFICEQELGQCPCQREAVSMITSRPKCRGAIGFGFIAACRSR